MFFYFWKEINWTIKIINETSSASDWKFHLMTRIREPCTMFHYFIEKSLRT